MRSVSPMLLSVLALLITATGCAPLVITERNAFARFVEDFGGPAPGDTVAQGPGGGVAAASEFRRRMTVSFVNTHVDADVRTAMVAWVELGSIRDADQQDALLRDGYVVLTRETRIGSSITLPAGTYVFNGPGVAGATSITLGSTQGSSRVPATQTIDLLTPDVILVFSQPPTSCDSVAFDFSRDGEVVFDDDGFIFLRTFGEVGYKTLAQIDVYQCQPLKPGLYLKTGGGRKQANEYFEGESVTFSFNEVADADGNHANVTIAP